MIRFSRPVPGGTATGADIGEVAWTQEEPIRVWGATGARGLAGADGNDGAAGAKGAKGDTGSRGATGATGAKGTDGAAGVGIEYIFASSTNGNAITGTANLPDPNWNFDVVEDAGRTRGNQKYYDGTPTDITLDRPYVIRFNRPIPGGTASGADVGSVTWNQEASVKVFGRDGEDGLDGVDGESGVGGVGIEFIFAVHNYAVLPASLYPLNTLGYDFPRSTAGAGAIERTSRPNRWRTPELYRYSGIRSTAAIRVRYARANGQPNPASPGTDQTPPLFVYDTDTGRSWSSGVPNGTDQLYYIIGVREPDGSDFVWDDPVAIRTQVAVRTVYRKDSSTPNEPTSGYYRTGRWSNPSGWQSTVPTLSFDDVYFSIAIADADRWPRGSGETRSLTWYDGKNTGLPDPNEANPYLATARRLVTGRPPIGTDVLDEDDWVNVKGTQWKVESYRAFGSKGDKGDKGDPGDAAPRVWTRVFDDSDGKVLSGSYSSLNVNISSYDSVYAVVSANTNRAHWASASIPVARIPTSSAGYSAMVFWDGFDMALRKTSAGIVSVRGSYSSGNSGGRLYELWGVNPGN